MYEQGCILESLGQHARAYAVLTKAMELLSTGSDEYVQVLIHRATCSGKLGKKQEALMDIQEALFYDEDDMRAVFDRSEYYIAKDPASYPALEDLARVLTDPNLAEAHAECHFRAGTIYAAFKMPQVSFPSPLSTLFFSLFPPHP